MRGRLNSVCFFTGVSLVFCLCFLTVAIAQDSEPAESIKPTAKTVKYGFFVTDGKDALVNEITKEDLIVRVNGKPVDDFVFWTSTAPLLTILAADNSGSMREVLEYIIDGSKQIVDGANADDLTLLMRFVSSDKLFIEDRFSADKDFLHRKLDGFYIEGGSTAIVDAIYEGVKFLGEKDGPAPGYRRAMIIVSDGEDRDSVYRSSQLLKLLGEKNVQVVFVGLLSGLHKNQSKKSMEFIESIVNASGGFAVYPTKTSGFALNAKHILPALRDQLYLEFGETDDKAKIEISLSPEMSRKKYKLYSRLIEN